QPRVLQLLVAPQSADALDRIAQHIGARPRSGRKIEQGPVRVEHACADAGERTIWHVLQAPPAGRISRGFYYAAPNAAKRRDAGGYRRQPGDDLSIGSSDTIWSRALTSSPDLRGKISCFFDTKSPAGKRRRRKPYCRIFLADPLQYGAPRRPVARGLSIRY